MVIFFLYLLTLSSLHMYLCVQISPPYKDSGHILITNPNDLILSLLSLYRPYLQIRPYFEVLSVRLHQMNLGRVQFNFPLQSLLSYSFRFSGEASSSELPSLKVLFLPWILILPEAALRLLQSISHRGCVGSCDISCSIYIEGKSYLIHSFLIEHFSMKRYFVNLNYINVILTRDV